MNRQHQTDSQADEQTDGETDRQADKQRWRDRDRQTDRQTATYSFVSLTADPVDIPEQLKLLVRLEHPTANQRTRSRMFDA